MSKPRADQTLRIAMVTTFYPPFSFGGDGIYIQRLSRSLAVRGHHVEVIHDTDGYRAMTGRTPDIPSDDDGVTVHRLGSAQPMLASLAVQQTGRPVTHRRALNRLLGDRFDVIHFHNISLVGGPGIWACGTGVKLHMAHEHWLVCPTHILWRYNREICDERHCVRCSLSYRRPPQLWRGGTLMERSARHVDRFLTLSQSAADNHRRFGFAPEMEVFPSFLPLSESDGRPPPPSGTRPYFLFVGRLEILKGLQDVIPVFDADMPADLVVAGTGNHEPALRKLAEGRDNVRFLGNQTMDQLRGLYAGARAVVTPSSCYEVFPLVVLEAFRDSTPIIARNLGPYPEIVTSTGGGQLFSDQTSLRHALLAYANDAASARAHGAAGRRAFDANWSEDVVIARYFALIAELAARKGLTETARKASLLASEAA